MTKRKHQAPADVLAPCPYGDKGRHELNVILPETSANPALLFCDTCGTTRYLSLDLPTPLDDLPNDAIAKLARRGSAT